VVTVRWIAHSHAVHRHPRTRHGGPCSAHQGRMMQTDTRPVQAAYLPRHQGPGMVREGDGCCWCIHAPASALLERILICAASPPSTSIAPARAAKRGRKSSAVQKQTSSERVPATSSGTRDGERVVCGGEGRYLPRHQVPGLVREGPGLVREGGPMAGAHLIGARMPALSISLKGWSKCSLYSHISAAS
jgi:hypothetical protein